MNEKQKEAYLDFCQVFNISHHSLLVAFTIAQEKADEQTKTEYGTIAENDIAKVRQILNPN